MDAAVLIKKISVDDSAVWRITAYLGNLKQFEHFFRVRPFDIENAEVG